MILGTRQLAKLLKYISIKTANGHYREMAWLPFQKIKKNYANNTAALAKKKCT